MLCVILCAHSLYIQKKIVQCFLKSNIIIPYIMRILHIQHTLWTLSFILFIYRMPNRVQSIGNKTQQHNSPVYLSYACVIVLFIYSFSLSFSCKSVLRARSRFFVEKLLTKLACSVMFHSLNRLLRSNCLLNWIFSLQSFDFIFISLSEFIFQYIPKALNFEIHTFSSVVDTWRVLMVLWKKTINRSECSSLCTDLIIIIMIWLGVVVGREIDVCCWDCCYFFVANLSKWEKYPEKPVEVELLRDNFWKFALISIFEC